MRNFSFRCECKLCLQVKYHVDITVNTPRDAPSNAKIFTSPIALGVFETYFKINLCYDQVCKKVVPTNLQMFNLYTWEILMSSEYSKHFYILQVTLISNKYELGLLGKYIFRICSTLVDMQAANDER